MTSLAARLITTSLLILAFFVSPSLSQDTQRVYDAADPLIGYNLISYKSDDPNEQDEYLTAIDELVAVGADHVNLVVFRRVRVDGSIDFKSGPKFMTIYQAAQRAKSKNLKVTLTPIFETKGKNAWRGNWNPIGTARRNFLKHYAAFVRQLARVAARAEADKLMLGSELVAFVNDPSNHHFLNAMAALCGKTFQGELGYNANWNNFKSPRVKEVFWDHPRINAMSVSMYPSNRLATIKEADQSHLDPESFAQTVKNRWNAILLKELLPYAATLKDNAGMPVLIGEFGAVALNRCAAAPAAFEPSTKVDAKEQEAVIMGLIQSVDQLGDQIHEVTIWQWGIGDLSDRFGLNPFHKSPQQSTALKICEFMQTADMPDNEWGHQGR